MKMKKTKVEQHINQFLAVSGLTGSEVARTAALTGAVIGINTVFDLKVDKKKIVAELNWLEAELRKGMTEDAGKQSGGLH